MKTLVTSSRILSVFLFLAIPYSVSLAQVITPSGLNTAVSAPILSSGQTQFNITGGTRPGGGLNLFHSFGDFNVPNNNIANFLNNSGLDTSNILGRVTGGNVSNIFGTIQTTGFGNANLFLMNPAGFLFGPNATVNVGGMVTFTSADYLRLSDGARFNAIPHTAPDLLLSAAPVAAFGFLGLNPGAITVQGSQLSVTDGTGISLVGGNLTVQTGTLTAPSGQINLVSVDKPSHPKVGGEVVLSGGLVPTGFRSLGSITLTQGSTVDTSATLSSGHAAGGVLIRGGRFVMDDSSIQAVSVTPGSVGGNIEVTAKQVALSNHSSIDAHIENPTGPGVVGRAGNITFNVGTFSATDSEILASAGGGFVTGGSVTIQGLQGSGASAHSVSLTNTTVTTGTSSDPFPGVGAEHPILIRADNIALNQSSLDASVNRGTGGVITLVSKGGLEMRNSSLVTKGGLPGSGAGTVNLRAGTGIDLTDTLIDAHEFLGSGGGTITMAAPVISLRGSTLDVRSEDLAAGGTILINGGARFTSQQSTISAQSVNGHGGIIEVHANKVRLTDTQLTTSVSGGPQTVGGTITIDGNAVRVKNSQILSTATEGQGGTIDITATHRVVENAASVISATSATGPNGSVTITAPVTILNGVVEP
jgi:filamentous hemagglutinin family protein